MTKTAKIIALREQGEKYVDIARRVGCTRDYVSAVMQRHRGGGRSASDERYHAKCMLLYGMNPTAVRRLRLREAANA